MEVDDQSSQRFAAAAEKLITLVDTCRTDVYDENWVNAMESICNMVHTGLPYAIGHMKRTDLVDQLILCTLDGLDIEKAARQLTVFPIRHLKAGIRLATILFETDRMIMEKLLKIDIQGRLLDQLEDNITSAPVALQILKALDASIVFGVGLDAFLVGSQSSDMNHSLTPYQRLTRYILKKRSSRVMVAAHCLMRKIVFHQSLKNVFSVARKLALHSSNAETPPKNDEDQNSVSSSNAEAILEEDDISSLCENLMRITELYKNANDLLAQPSRCLPTAAIFSRQRAPTGHQMPNDVYPAVYAMFNRNHLLPSLYLILSHWSTGSEPRIVICIHQLLSMLLASQSGLLYLASHEDVMKEILQFLLQKSEDSSEEENTSLMHELAVEMVHYFRALHCVDSLMEFHHSGIGKQEVDNPEALETLRSFYVLTLDQINDRRGVKAVVRILSWSDYLGALLPFIELTGDAEWDNKIRKSACAGYASELLLLVLRYAESVDYLKIFQDRLLAISSQEVTSKISEVKQWVEPLRKLPGFGLESVETLAEKIKTFVQTEGIVPRIPKGLITTLRLAQHIAVQPQKTEDGEAPIELRYNYALIQFHQLDVIANLLQLVDKLADSHLLNWQQGISLNNKHGHIFYACVIPAMALIRNGLSYLIHCRGNEFKDLTAIETLLKLYNVCCTFVPSFGVLSEGQIVQKEIIATLLAYTQPEGDNQPAKKDKDDESGGVEASLWTKMIGEVLKFTAEAPYRYVAGLNVLSELLPLPLPLPTKEPLTQQGIEAVQAHRRVWSSHLLPIADRIQAMIRDLVQSTQHTLQQGLRRVSLQLSDLSPDIANVVVRAVINIALENGEIKETKGNPNEPDEPPVVVKREIILPATPAFARVLTLLSYMVSQSSFKACFLSLLHSKKEKQADDYGRLLHYLLVILNHTSPERSHGACQEVIVGTLQSLCDHEIGMITSEQGRSGAEQLASCLPDAQQLREICCVILKHVRNPSHTYATILPALRIFVMLCEHDYGLDSIKKALQTEHGALPAFLERLLDEFSGHSSDCISTLSTLLLLLRSLQVVDEGAQWRTKKIDFPQARKYLDWKADSGNENHSLVKLKDMLAAAMEEDSSLYSLYDDVNNLITMLSSTDGSGTDGSRDRDDEPTHLPPAPDIVHQFSNRQVWVSCTDPSEDRLQAHYWFPIDVLEDDDEQETERVAMNLGAMQKEYVPEFDLEKELAAKISAKRAEEAEAIKRKVIPGIINTSRGERKRFVAPLRGRGMVPRGGVSTRMNDPFRSRVPNTSRPPSMHVDDFILAQHTMSNAPMGGQDGGDGAMGKPTPKDGSRLSSSRGGGDRSGMGHSSRYRSPMDDRGRGFPKPGSAAAPTGMGTYRPRGNVFDRPRDRHGGSGSGSSRHPSKSSRSSSSRKSPSRHRASSK